MSEQLEVDLLIMRNLKMKPNYSELERKYGLTRQTISKYDKGFIKKETRSRSSFLDKYKKDIVEK